MAAFRDPLTIDQGSTWRARRVWKAGTPAVPVDLTGCTARMHVRSVVDAAEILLELTTENGRIALGGTTGTIDLQLTAAETAGITWQRAGYDLEIVHPDGTVRRLLQGSVKVTREFTRG